MGDSISVTQYSCASPVCLCSQISMVIVFRQCVMLESEKYKAKVHLRSKIWIYLKLFCFWTMVKYRFIGSRDRFKHLNIMRSSYFASILPNIEKWKTTLKIFKSKRRNMSTDIIKKWSGQKKGVNTTPKKNSSLI
jgi:hypothetical protein